MIAGRVPAALGILLAAVPAAAGLGDELRLCAGIEAAPERLACYDRLAQGQGAAAAPEQDFGLPDQAGDAAEPEEIRSALAGAFTGWRPGTVFTLRNGQVWQCVNDDQAFYPRIPENPEVTIRRRFMGAYWMEVAGVSRKIKVRRLK